MHHLRLVGIYIIGLLWLGGMVEWVHLFLLGKYWASASIALVGLGLLAPVVGSYAAYFLINTLNELDS